MVPKRVESSRAGIIGHIQAGDNYFDLRRRMVRFWGEWSAEEVAATTKMIYER